MAKSNQIEIHPCDIIEVVSDFKQAHRVQYEVVRGAIDDVAGPTRLIRRGQETPITRVNVLYAGSVDNGNVRLSRPYDSGFYIIEPRIPSGKPVQIDASEDLPAPTHIRKDNNTGTIVRRIITVDQVHPDLRQHVREKVARVRYPSVA